MSERFRRVRDLFESSLNQAPNQRDAWLREVCCGDEELAWEVSALLAANQTGGFLDAPLLPAPERKPQRLGPYEILDEVGRGGMGAVYRAVRSDEAFQKVVAVKVLGTDGFGYGQAERFQRERQILARLEHPNIARILDGGSEQGTPYLVMEYVEGIPIDRYCETRQLDIKERVALFHQICEAVDYAHRNLVVHRDLKPGNVLVTAEGFVKLLDFGIAVMLSPDGGAGSTITLQLTPDYASPEQICGGPVTPASDVYSLGVMLFHLLTRGVLPRHTKGENVADLAALAAADPPAPSSRAPAAWRDQLRGDLDCIVLQALAREPQRRYATAGRLGDDLTRFREGLPVAAHGDSTSYRVRKFARRHWVSLTTVAAVMAALLGAVVVTARQAGIARVEKELADSARAGEQRQRLRAEAALRSAEAARQRALEEKVRAEHEATEATRQRILAESRYQDVRSLATTVLFDIHDQIRGLAGASEARRVAVTKALQYLDGLSRQSQDDPGLQSDLAAAYERTGDILGNIADSSMEGAQAAISPYSKALDLRRRVMSRRPGNAAAQESLAHAYEKMGVGYLGLGRGKEAVASFEAALKLVGSEPLFRAALFDRLSSAYAALSDFNRSISYCREALALLEAPQIGASAPDRLIARVERQYGILLALNGKSTEAIVRLRRSADQFLVLARREPDQVTYRRAYASMLPILGKAFEDSGQNEEAAKIWIEAKDALTEMLPNSPTDPQIVLTLAYTLKRIAWDRYHASTSPDRDDRGESEMALSLKYSERMASRPQAGAHELIEYADTLVKAPFPRLQNPQRALQFALRGNELSNFRNPLMLDTLAWAYYRTGDSAAAITTMEKALALLSPSGGSFRKEFEDGLRQFRERQ